MIDRILYMLLILPRHPESHHHLTDFCDVLSPNQHRLTLTSPSAEDPKVWVFWKVSYFKLQKKISHQFHTKFREFPPNPSNCWKILTRRCGEDTSSSSTSKFSRTLAGGNANFMIFHPVFFGESYGSRLSPTQRHGLAVGLGAVGIGNPLDKPGVYGLMLLKDRPTWYLWRGPQCKWGISSENDVLYHCQIA